MAWMKEHRSERPAIWDYSNPRAEKRVSLRKKLASGKGPDSPKTSAPAQTSASGKASASAKSTAAGKKSAPAKGKKT